MKPIEITGHRPPAGPSGAPLPPKAHPRETSLATEIVHLGRELRDTMEELCPFQTEKRPRWRRIKPVHSVTAPYTDAIDATVKDRARLVRPNMDPDEPIELWVDSTKGDSTSPAVKQVEIDADGTPHFNPDLYLNDGPLSLEQMKAGLEFMVATVNTIVQEHNRERFVRAPMAVLVGEWFSEPQTV